MKFTISMSTAHEMFRTATFSMTNTALQIIMQFVVCWKKQFSIAANDCSPVKWKRSWIYKQFCDIPPETYETYTVCKHITVYHTEAYISTQQQMWKCKDTDWVKCIMNERQKYLHQFIHQFCSVDNRFTSGRSYTQWVPTSWKYCSIYTTVYSTRWHNIN